MGGCGWVRPGPVRSPGEVAAGVGAHVRFCAGSGELAGQLNAIRLIRSRRLTAFPKPLVMRQCSIPRADGSGTSNVRSMSCVRPVRH